MLPPSNVKLTFIPFGKVFIVDVELKPCEFTHAVVATLRLLSYVAGETPAVINPEVDIVVMGVPPS